MAVPDAQPAAVLHSTHTQHAPVDAPTPLRRGGRSMLRRLRCIPSLAVPRTAGSSWSVDSGAISSTPADHAIGSAEPPQTQADLPRARSGESLQGNEQLPSVASSAIARANRSDAECTCQTAHRAPASFDRPSRATAAATVAAQQNDLFARPRDAATALLAATDTRTSSATRTPLVRPAQRDDEQSCDREVCSGVHTALPSSSPSASSHRTTTAHRSSKRGARGTTDRRSAWQRLGIGRLSRGAAMTRRMTDLQAATRLDPSDAGCGLQILSDAHAGRAPRVPCESAGADSALPRTFETKFMEPRRAMGGASGLLKGGGNGERVPAPMPPTMVDLYAETLAVLDSSLSDLDGEHRAIVQQFDVQIAPGTRSSAAQQYEYARVCWVCATTQLFSITKALRELLATALGVNAELPTVPSSDIAPPDWRTPPALAQPHVAPVSVLQELASRTDEAIKPLRGVAAALADVDAASRSSRRVAALGAAIARCAEGAVAHAAASPLAAAIGASARAAHRNISALHTLQLDVAVKLVEVTGHIRAVGEAQAKLKALQQWAVSVLLVSVALQRAAEAGGVAEAHATLVADVRAQLSSTFSIRDELMTMVAAANSDVEAISAGSGPPEGALRALHGTARAAAARIVDSSALQGAAARMGEVQRALEAARVAIDGAAASMHGRAVAPAPSFEPTPSAPPSSAADPRDLGAAGQQPARAPGVALLPAHAFNALIDTAYRVQHAQQEIHVLRAQLDLSQTDVDAMAALVETPEQTMLIITPAASADHAAQHLAVTISFNDGPAAVMQQMAQVVDAISRSLPFTPLAGPGPAAGGHPRPPRGAAPAELAQLPVTVCDADGAPDDVCAICFEAYKAGEECCALPCGHRMHRDHLHRALSISAWCPVCRTCMDGVEEAPAGCSIM